MTLSIGDEVRLYHGEGGRGVVMGIGDGTAKVRFADGQEVWCALKNLTP